MNFTQKFTKRDLGFAVLTGLITGGIMWRVFDFLKVPHILDIIPNLFFAIAYKIFGTSQLGIIVSHAWWIVVVPVLWILGVLLGYLLGQWFQFFNQFGKFVAIGFTNAAVTFGALNVLIAQTNYTSGLGYVLISALSFVVGVISSYIWNKYWAFDAGRSGGGVSEFFKFVSVALVALLVNTTVSSIVVNLVDPAFGFDAKQWANIGVVIGSAAGLIFSFIGFKLTVFKN